MFAAPRGPEYIRRLRTTGLLFFAPALVLLAAFVIAPIFVAVFVSFTKYTILSPPSFVGLANYARVFTMPSFANSVQVTAIYVFARVAVLIAFALFIGTVINQRISLSGFFTGVYFIPYVFPIAVVSVVWKLLYRPFGLIEQLTLPLGIGPISWLTTGDYALTAITISTVWSAVGYYAIIVLAGLQTIPKDVLEASVIDGAGVFRRFLHVVLPLLKPTLFYMVVVGVINSIRGFPPFLVMTGGGPGEATRVVGLIIYEFGFARLRMGVASAMSVVVLAIILIFTLVQMRFYRYDSA
jgi:ABC-type sugar transport system permease subunit